MSIDHPDFEELLEFLKQTRSFDFTGYKRASLIRRVEKRMQSLGINSFPDFQDYLQVHPEEFSNLFNTILINVTEFFRDKNAWDYLAQEIIPKILYNKVEDEPIRIWSAGCASGEEAYSVAILFAELLGEEAFKQRVKIYATDVDDAALAKARNSEFSEKDLQTVPAEYRQLFFSLVNGSFTFNKELRRSLIFGRNDLILDAPISRVDLLICRNTLMYFNAETQAKILNRFHFALRNTGYLFLGKAETLVTHAQTFTPVNMRLRIFRKAGQVNLRDRMMLMAQGGDTGGINHLINLTRARETSFETAPVAMMVVDVNSVLLLANAVARVQLNINQKDFGRSFHNLELSYRAFELRSGIMRAFADHLGLMLSNVSITFGGGEAHIFDIRIQPLFDNGDGLLGLCLSLIDVTQHKLLEKQLENSNEELETTLDELQSSNEELETTNEELQSTMEEMETTNEELQSANEEMETMNEELQSTNEELHTLYHEIKLRTDELNQVNKFMNSILHNLKMGVAVLDNDLRVLTWNSKSEDLWGLRSEEVYLQNFLHLDIGLPLDQLLNPIRACLDGNADQKVLLLDAINRRGRKIQCEVECIPMYDPEKKVSGLIVTMVDQADMTAGIAKDGNDND